MTIKEWLTNLSETKQSNETDDKEIQSLLRKAGFPQAIVTCGIVYITGRDNPVDIHSTAKMILKAG